MNMIIKLFAFSNILIFSLPLSAQNFELKEYLSQVRNSNPAFKSSALSAESAKEKEELNGLEFSPIFFSEVSYVDDEGPRQSPAFQGEQSKNTAYSLAVSKKTRFGLDAELSYNVGRTQIIGAQPSLVPITDFYGNTLKFEVTQSLWKNAFGFQNTLRESSGKLENESQALQEKYAALQALVSAEKSYWTLAFSKKIVEVQNEGLKRSKEILEYNSRRKRKKLADEADVLQSQAGYELRLLEIENSKTNLRAALQSFNSLRGKEELGDVPEMITPKIDEILQLQPPKNDQLKLDTLAAQKNKESTIARSKISADDLKPDLEVFGSLATGSLEQSFSEAADESFTTNNPITTVGIRLSVPLDRSIIKKGKSSYSKDIIAASLSFERKLLDQKVEWNNLVNKFKELKRRLDVSKRLESAQYSKLKNERSLQKRGQSTTFQVLTFEQDYLDAQLQTQNLMLEALKTYADFKKFGRI